ncbi:hypothetical protein LTR56_007523 [Elasticomyces elasticus]|nr:hypothetical protein LTR56_007523 [Elasticomyces elasticus]KAK3668155.1 hypothetical protein LTR22_000840 [Elasticomyces elasticus]KAK4921399.1 hypothetical protein LTR49_011229 [Elasticomyces elasticus]KAK5769518.1 hypothetical protein LTS12_000445 [Elasticomyces elasticus]
MARKSSMKASKQRVSGQSEVRPRESMGVSFTQGSAKLHGSDAEDVEPDHSDAPGQGMMSDSYTGKILHLGSELPDPPPQKNILRRSGLERTMQPSRIQNPSRISSVLGRPAIARPGSNRLSAALKPSTNFVNPAYQNPAREPLVLKHLLRGGDKARRDTYAVDDTPVLSKRHQKPVPVQHMQPISPTKKLKKFAVKTLDMPALPRPAEPRSLVQMSLDAQLDGAITDNAEQEQDAGGVRRSTVRPNTVEEVPALLGAEDDHDPQDSAPVSLPADVASEDEEIDDATLQATLTQEIDDMEVQQGAPVSPQQAPRRKRGRPGKSAPDIVTQRVATAVEIPTQESLRPSKGPQITSASPQKFRSQPSAPAVRPAAKMSNGNEQAKQARQSHQARVDIVAKARKLKPTKQAKQAGKNACLNETTSSPRQTSTAPQIQTAANQDPDSGKAAHPEHPAMVDDEEDSSQSETMAGASSRLPTTHPDRIRAVDLEFDTLRDDLEPSPEKQPIRATASNKRRRGSDSAQNVPNLPRKRQRALAANEAPAAPIETVSETDRQRYYKQWHELRKVRLAIRNIGVQHINGEAQPQHRIKLMDDKVKAAMSCCNDVILKMIHGEDAATDLIAVANEVDALHDASNDEEDFGNMRRVKNIYFHLFPQLIKMVWEMVRSYEALDRRVEPDAPMTRLRLRQVKEVIKLIIDLGAGAKEYSRPSSELALVQPVDNGIVAPLKTIYRELTIAYQNLERRAEDRRQRQLEAERNARAAEQEKRAEREAEQVRKTRQRWERLHTERRWAEGTNIVSKAKEQHLLCESVPQQERDQNGELFERLQVFHPRVGPSPAAVEQAQGVVWDDDESQTLAEKLKYYGEREPKVPDVLVAVIRDCCLAGNRKTGLPRGPLNRFNVTEIVTCAALLKAYLRNVQLTQSGLVEDWVEEIPDWTKERSMGKENDDVEQVADEEMDE